MNNLGPLLAVQTYTIREDLKKDLSGALSRIAAMGIPAVELARIPFTPANALEVQQVCASTGLVIACLQVKFRVLNRDFRIIVDFCKTVRCPKVSVSVLPLGCILGGTKPLEQFAKKLEVLAHQYACEGVTLVFHHHNFEFVTLGSPGTTEEITKFDVLFNNTSVGFILDTYWAEKSGHNPADLVRKLGPRLAGLHLRDLDSITRPNGQRKETDCELGRGSVDFQQLFQAMEEHGSSTACSYVAIEQNTRTPWESIQMSLNFLQEAGLKNYLVLGNGIADKSINSSIKSSIKSPNKQPINHKKERKHHG